MAHAITATVVATFMFMLKKIRKKKLRMNTISIISGKINQFATKIHISSAYDFLASNFTTSSK